MRHTPLTVLAIALLLGACAPTRHEIVAGRVYPRQALRGTTLDIQVFKTARHVELTNTTTRRFGPSILWLNGRFSRAIDGLEVGETVKFRLHDFKDEFSESFREGGFFATQRGDRLVLAELESGGEVLGLIVIGEQEE